MIHYENLDQEKVAGWMIQLANLIKSNRIIISDEERKEIMEVINEIYDNHLNKKQEENQER